MCMAMTMMMLMVTELIMLMMMFIMTVGMVVPSVMRDAGRAVRAMPMRGLCIGASLGIERRFDLDHPRAQSPHHCFDHVIAPDAQGLCHDLRRQMAISEMPGHPDQMLRVVAANFGQRLGRGDHLDQPAVFEHQRIATAQGDDAFQVEQKRK